MKANKSPYTKVTCAQIEILKSAYNMINKDPRPFPIFSCFKNNLK
jgi:hypothetical protein